MKDVLMFYLDSCGYCDKARRALEELFAPEPAYRQIPLTRIEESEQPALADTYDYYAVPSFFIGKEKLFEAHIGMRYEDIKAEVRRCLDAAL